MERVTISSSLRHKELIRQAIKTLNQAGVTALFPNLDGEIAKEEVTLELLKNLQAEHFEAIDRSEALYVICPEGRVGLLVSAEVGYACAIEKPRYFSEQPEDLGMQALATGYLPLEKIVELKNF